MSSKATEMAIYSDMTSKYGPLIKLLYLAALTAVQSAAEELQVVTQQETSFATKGHNCIGCDINHHNPERLLEIQNLNTVNNNNLVNNSFALAGNSSLESMHLRSIYLSVLDILNRMNHTKSNQETKPPREQENTNGLLIAAETNNVPSISVRRLDGGSVADERSGSGSVGGRQEKTKRNIGYTTSRPFSSGHNNQVEPMNVDVYSEFPDSLDDQPRQTVVELNKKAKTLPATSTYSDDFTSSPELLPPKLSLEKTQSTIQQQNQPLNSNDNYPNQYTTQSPPLEVSFSAKQSSAWKPSGARFNNYELNQPPDKPLFSMTSSVDQHQVPSSSFMSSSIRDAVEQRAPSTEDVPAEAARFNSMFQNFERNEFPQIADQTLDYYDAEQVIRSKSNRPRNIRRGPRQKRPIALNNYAVQPSYNGERIRKPHFHHSTTTISESNKPPLRESQLESEDYDASGSQATRLSANFGDVQDEQPLPPRNNQAPPTKHLNQGVYLQQVDTKPISSHYSFQYHPQAAFTPAPPPFTTTQTSHQHQPQKIYYTLVPQTAYKTSSTTSGQVGSLLTSSTGTSSVQPQAQPQTIQITAIPSGLGINNQPTVVRVNGLSNLGTNVGGGLLGGTANNWLDASGRPMVMVPSERRLDWSWLVWPVAVVVALPLVLSALFVPVFLKSMVIFIQILQSLGLVMPISNAINQHLSNSSSNITHHLAS